MTTDSSDRIQLIDSFRAIAILMVIVFHYFAHFSPPQSDVNYYPYLISPPWIAIYGFYGVQLFFVISGFVIAQTLERNVGLGPFLKKRWIRLYPSLVLCSLVTFFVGIWLAPDLLSFIVPTSVLDFLPTLSFVPPAFWQWILNRPEIDYVDGVVWSLFTEAMFYVVAGCVFSVVHKGTFLSSWVRLVLGIQLIRILASPRNQDLFPDEINATFRMIYRGYFALTLNYWVYFALGIFIYDRYRERATTRSTLAMIAVLILLEFYFLGDHSLRFLFLFILILFGLFLIRPTWIAFLKWRPLVIVGLISYPLYLLHESIGLILIHWMGNSVGPILAIWIPFVVMAIMIFASYAVYQYFERPLTLWLRGRLLNESR